MAITLDAAKTKRVVDAILECESRIAVLAARRYFDDHQIAERDREIEFCRKHIERMNEILANGVVNA